MSGESALLVWQNCEGVRDILPSDTERKFVMQLCYHILTIVV